MKKIFLLLIVLGIAGNVQAEMDKDGFKGHKWGTNFNEFDSSLHLEKLSEKDGLVIYGMPLDKFGGVKVHECILKFENDKFFQVIIKVLHLKYCVKLRNRLKRDYGNMIKKNNVNYSFNDETTSRKFEIDQDLEGNYTGILTMSAIETEDVKTKAKAKETQEKSD